MFTKSLPSSELLWLSDVMSQYYVAQKFKILLIEHFHSFGIFLWVYIPSLSMIYIEQTTVISTGSIHRTVVELKQVVWLQDHCCGAYLCYAVYISFMCKHILTFFACVFSEGTCLVFASIISNDILLNQQYFIKPGSYQL
jgi:hypothetical protein